MQHSAESLLENTRRQFPRLYFVSDEVLMQALSSHPTHNDCHLRRLLLTRQCFHGVDDVLFELPSSRPPTSATRWSSTVNCMIDLLVLIRRVLGLE